MVDDVLADNIGHLMKLRNITKSLKGLLKEHYEIDVTGVQELPLGADLKASVYRVESPDQKKYFVKVRHGSFDQKNLDVLAFLQSQGIRNIIAPMQNRNGNLVQKESGFSIVVFPFIEGEDAFHQSLNDQQWIQFGTVLSKIHTMEVPQIILKSLRREDFSSEWRDRLRSIYSKIHDLQTKEQTGVKLKNLLMKHWITIEKILDHAESLSEKVKDRPLEYVLCHSDIHGGNLLLGKDKAFYIVDWDEVMMAPKERDLMFIGAGICKVWNQKYEEDLFYKGYGETFVDRKILAYYRFERIVVDIVEYAQELIFKEQMSGDKELMYRQVEAMFDPGNVVECAFKLT